MDKYQLVVQVQWKSSRWQMFFKIGISQACNFVKKRLQHRYFPMRYTKKKINRTPRLCQALNTVNQ